MWARSLGRQGIAVTMSQSRSLTYRKLRAPRGDGELLVDPQWTECLSHPEKNRETITGYQFEILGRDFQLLRKQMRGELLALAKAFTAEYSPSLAQNNLEVEQPIVMTGHQPRLFHPGVWAKNFAVHQLAQHVQGVGINVVIDNDTMRTHSVRVPTGDKESPSVVAEAFDSFHEPVPFERRFAKDHATLASFPDRVTDRLRSILDEVDSEPPLAVEIWPDVLTAVDRGKPLGHAFAEARHQLERRWGVDSLEVTLSQLCDTEVFHWFALDLLLRGQDVADSYNKRLDEYRHVHRLRSAAQPLPDLAQRDGWCEAPFWFWTSDDSKRRALWWIRSGYDLILSDDRHEQEWTLKNATRTASDGYEQLHALCESQFSIRPRALTNTIFLRLFCSDAFLHGIGGAKYDQITNLLMADLYGITPPEFVALSQTTKLPATYEVVSAADYAEKRVKLREMYFHPEKFLDSSLRDDPKVSSIEKNKWNLVGNCPPRGERGKWHRDVEAANGELRNFLLEKSEKQKEINEYFRSRLGASQILGSREWSFCLFPKEFLKKRLLDLNLMNF